MRYDTMIYVCQYVLSCSVFVYCFFFFFQAEDGIRDLTVTGVQTCALPICRDSVHWREYEFRWKPGDVTRRPGFVAPHQPRLDWQMWFAALDPAGAEAWLAGLMRGVLEGTPQVVSLLGADPFPDAPPRYVRLAYYRYRFSTRAERARTGAWWSRELTGYLTRPVSLADLSLHQR